METGCGSGAWTVFKTMDFGQPTISVTFLDPSYGISTDLAGGIHYTEDGGVTWTEVPLPLPMGMFHLTRDGIHLTHVDLIEHGKITLLFREMRFV